MTVQIAPVAKKLVASMARFVTAGRSLKACSVPLSFDQTYLPLEIGKKIITNNLKVESIFSLLERKYMFS
jgi:GntR family transcriptional regulator